MIGDYIDDLWSDLQRMDEEEVLEEYEYHNRKGQEIYEDYKERMSEPVPDCLLDKRVDDWKNDYSWNKVKGVFRDRLGRDPELYELKEQLTQQLPIHGEDNPQPKI